MGELTEQETEMVLRLGKCEKRLIRPVCARLQRLVSGWEQRRTAARDVRRRLKNQGTMKAKRRATAGQRELQNGGKCGEMDLLI